MDCFFLDFSLNAAIFNENFDLKNVITPMKSEVLAQLLREAGYDERKTIFLERGFTSGFTTAMRGLLAGKVRQIIFHSQLGIMLFCGINL